MVGLDTWENSAPTYELYYAYRIELAIRLDIQQYVKMGDGIPNTFNFPKVVT